jgi:GT2 family glycosyltransferase
MSVAPPRLKIAIGIATTGRRNVLADVIGYFSLQTRLADALIICPAKPEDVDLERLSEYGAPVTVIPGPTGLPKQRNVILDNTDADVVAFFDDDFLPAADFLEELETYFVGNPELVAITGNVLADGAHGPGLAFEDGVRILDVAQKPDKPFIYIPTFGTYGCNMAVRVKVAREHNIRFDEKLPLYGWWEDIDFSRRLIPHGRIMRSAGLRGVHLGSKSGRTSGRRLGYSQVANIIYMARKGSVPGFAAFKQITRNVVANHFKALKPEPWVDRAGRVRGNWHAIGDLITGRIDPERILKL